jgi:hypothetical protein
LSDTWITDLRHFLDENGQIAPQKGPARRLAEYITAIIVMASGPELVIPPEHAIQCRRRPGRKPCPGVIQVDIDPETEDVVWWCPVCGDNGYIRNWKGTIWDLSEAGSEPH